MSVTPNDSVVAPDVVAAARELIRNEGDGCIVPISELLDELSDKFGDGFRVSSDAWRILDLIHELWDDPHIHRPDNEFIALYAPSAVRQSRTDPYDRPGVQPGSRRLPRTDGGLLRGPRQCAS